jgi:uncharacterized phage-associated protein
MRLVAKKPSISFQLDLDRTREAILYIASKYKGGIEKYVICKLLFLADKYHLVRYGRTITGDRYVALPHGPAPSAALDSLNAVLNGEDRTSELATTLEVNARFVYPRLSVVALPEFENLSESDIEALDEIHARFGSKSFPELRAMTHEMAAYQKAWEKRGTRNSAPMAFEDFFEEDSDAIAGVLDEAIENSLLRKAYPNRKV